MGVSLPDRGAIAVPGYTVLRRLGAGAFGEVVAARCDETGETVALKRLRYGAGAIERESLRSEAALLAAFTHPGVIALRGVRFDDAGLVLVLDYAAGGDFAQLLARRGTVTPQEAALLGIRLAQTLEAAHSAGLLHTDICTRNVLLTDDGQPLLADLGTARLVGQQGAVTYSTEGFTDPQVLAGRPPSIESDVYGLGAVIAYALTGEPVRDAQSWAEQAHHAGVPAALVQAVCRTLASSPNSRCTLAQFVTDLRRAVPDLASLIELPGVLASTQTGKKSDYSESQVLPTALTRAVTPRIAKPVRLSGWRRFRATSIRHLLARGRDLVHPSVLSRVAIILVVVALAAGGALAWSTWRGDDAGAQALSAGKDGAIPGPSPNAADEAASPNNAAAPNQAAASKAAVSPPPTAQPYSLQRWTQIMTTLDKRRAKAFRDGDVEILSTVYTVQSALRATDASQIETLRNDNSTATGVRHDIEVVRIPAGSGSSTSLPGTEITLTVRDAMHAYQIRDGNDQILREIPAGETRELQIQLTKTEAGWRIHAMEPST